MSDTPLIVVVGSLNADLVSRVAHLPAPGETVSAIAFETYSGGKGANQACAAAKLGGRVALIGCVGDDDAGRRLRRGLEDAGVDVAAVDVVPGVPSGTALVTVDAAGQNQIIVVAGANDALTPDRLARHRALISSSAVLLLQLEVPLETVRAAARIARAAGALVILDPAPAPARPLPDDLLADVRYLTPNETELAALVETADERDDGGAEGVPRAAAAVREHQSPTDDARPAPPQPTPPQPGPTPIVLARARALVQRGVEGVIVTMGEAGARLVERTREHRWRAPAVAVVDTTGAGDTFNAALAVALAGGASIEAAGELACTAASMSVGRAGAQASMPTRADVRAMLPGW